MSVELLRLIHKVVSLEDRYKSGAWIGAVQILVGDLRSVGLQVGYAPIEKSPSMDENPYHCEVWGDITGSISRKIQKSAKWLVPIDGVELF